MKTTKLAATVAVVGFAAASLLAIGAAVKERQEQRRVVQVRADVLGRAFDVAASGAGSYTNLHVVINAVASRVAYATVAEPVEVAARRAAERCASDAALIDDGAPRDGNGSRYAHESIHQDGSEDGSAASVLCVFRVRGSNERREQITFLQRTASGTTSSVTIARESKVDADVYPATGDAPGQDPGTFPRPRLSRRLVSAAIRETSRDVWVYESQDALPRAMAELHRGMLDAGWERTPTPDATARLYHRGGEEVVVAFQSGATTRISISRSAPRA